MLLRATWESAVCEGPRNTTPRWGPFPKEGSSSRCSSASGPSTGRSTGDTSSRLGGPLPSITQKDIMGLGRTGGPIEDPFTRAPFKEEVNRVSPATDLSGDARPFSRLRSVSHLFDGAPEDVPTGPPKEAPREAPKAASPHTQKPPSPQRGEDIWLGSPRGLHEQSARTQGWAWGPSPSSKGTAGEIPKTLAAVAVSVQAPAGTPLKQTGPLIGAKESSGGLCVGVAAPSLPPTRGPSEHPVPPPQEGSRRRKRFTGGFFFVHLLRRRQRGGPSFPGEGPQKGPPPP